MELLAPVKNKESAFLAINLKVNAIYCSGPLYSARHNAGIDFDDLKEIIEYAHIYKTRVYITLNTLIFDNVMDSVIEYVDTLVRLNIDALIIQDLGLLHILKQRYPNLEIHASTQMHVHNKNGVSFVANNAISRIVLPRELTFEQTKKIKDSFPSLEFETFIHGALCTSYSGQCLYGAMNKAGSGNLGTCHQSCRKHHSITQKDEHLLSLRDLKVGSDVKQLEKITDSLKIEGRLKGLDYLYSTIKYYQSCLNSVEDIKMADLMQIAFNRQYTQGRLFNNNGNNIVNSTRINNQGLLIGKVVSSDKKYLTIRLNKKLTRLDNIRIVDGINEWGMVVDKIFYKGNEVESYNNDEVKIFNKSNLVLNGDVYIVKTRSYDNIIKDTTKKYLNKIMLDIQVSITIDKPMKVVINNEVYKSNFIVEQAQKQIMSFDDIKKQLSKTNDSLFKFNIDISGDEDVFIVKSKLNEFRRMIVDSEYKRVIKHENVSIQNYMKPKIESVDDYDCKYMVKTIQQAQALKDMRIKEIYVNNFEILAVVNIMFDKVIPVLPRVIKDDYFNKYLGYIEQFDSIMVSELGMLNELKNKKIIEANHSLNITNRFTMELLKNNSVVNAIISLEISKSVAPLKVAGIKASEIVYGHIPLMIMDYCPINLNKKDTCQECRLCQDKQYYLYDENNNKLPLVYSNDNILELYSNKPLKNKQSKDVNNSFIIFTIENYEQTKKIIKEYLNGNS